MERNRIPGAGVAVTDHGRLVLARGYGYADIGAKKQVQPTSMFRIASISKPITAVAIMQLVEQGKLKLEDRVLDILKYEPHLENDAKVDERWHDITVEQCCNTAAAGTAMFRSTPCSSRCALPAH